MESSYCLPILGSGVRCSFVRFSVFLWNLIGGNVFASSGDGAAGGSFILYKKLY